MIGTRLTQTKREAPDKRKEWRSLLQRKSARNRMRRIEFPGWPEVLCQTELSQRSKHSFEITIRWYLSFCRRARAEVAVQRLETSLPGRQRRSIHNPGRWKSGKKRSATRTSCKSRDSGSGVHSTVDFQGERQNSAMPGRRRSHWNLATGFAGLANQGFINVVNR